MEAARSARGELLDRHDLHDRARLGRTVEPADDEEREEYSEGKNEDAGHGRLEIWGRSTGPSLPSAATGAAEGRGLPFGLANSCILPFCKRRASTARGAPRLMPERIAALIVRFRWLIVAFWARGGRGRGSPRTAHRGAPECPRWRRPGDRGSPCRPAPEHRFARPFSEFFAVVIESPAPFTDDLPAAMLDSITEELRREPYVRSIILLPHLRTLSSWPRRAAHLPSGVGRCLDRRQRRQAGGARFRRALNQSVARVPYRDAYRTWVTGALPLDLDVRIVERRRQPPARGAGASRSRCVILVLAFGALVAAVLPLLVGFLAVAVSLTVIGLVAQRSHRCRSSCSTSPP